MKIFKNILVLMLLGACFAACKKQDYELGGMLDKSAIKFEVIQDLQADPGGNTVILVNNTPETVSMWDYGTGKSTRVRDTVKFAFKGDYVIKFSAMTAGGVVDMDPVTVKVTADNLNYVSDPLWLALTGGPGNEKTWILDYGEHGIFDGPVYYYEPQTTWKEINDGTAKLGWAPAWKDNTWIISADDKASTMTFSLIGGPFFKNHKVTEAKNESGTYYLDVNGKTLTTTGATILRSESFIANATNWNDKLVVLSLTENQLQVGVRRTNSEGDYLFVWNFISKTYADNYVPPVVADPGPDAGFDPAFQTGELLNLLTGGASSGRLWGLDAGGNPIDWIAKGRGWTVNAASTADWGWNSTWDVAATNSWIRFDRFGGQNYTRSQNGVLTTGTFTINEETNEINLGNNTLIQNAGSGINSAQHVLKVVKAFPEDATKGIWFGTSYDTAKDEWFAFHYVLQ